MTEPIDLFRRATAAFGTHVHAITATQWHDPTPCTEWDVRMLVNHVAVEQLWVPPLVAGMGVADVGSDLDGDQLGQAPVGAWDAAVAGSSASFGAPGALEGTVELSGGPRATAEYCWEMTVDALIHSWDLARAIGADETLDPELVVLVHARTLPMVEQLQETGLYAPPVPVPDDAPLQTKLLALFGRRAEHP
jgi:uncharacterized protein (TIGR03086 family)